MSLSESESHSITSDSLWLHGLHSPWNSPGQNTGVGSLSLLQRMFSTQELNPGIPHCRWILYQLSHRASPRILEWVPFPFSSGSSQSRNWTGVSCITGEFFTSWVIRGAPCLWERIHFPHFWVYEDFLDSLLAVIFYTLVLQSEMQVWDNAKL